MMPPMSKLKRKAQQANLTSVKAWMKQWLNSESVESIAAAVEMTSSSSAHVAETVSSRVRSAIKAPCISPGISNSHFTKHCRFELC